ncbi:hypothetical protein TREMEDRAFT_17281, partial [Tremella mesenterica DSM 1558]|uniref:uncharacterized protein n=1 Tax=Tremella mesenterica (strain ATCC 24925 / CBS 8224 / DSM 1558 / NBRC 9311 / NRRL Y-6157 / RJB 2259-6 / UBC 559-6) TaxID=578456 RepID=UPI0003F4962E
MFKKRTRPTSVREKPAEREEEAIAGPSDTNQVRDGVEEDDDTTQNIEELILIRKLRRPKPGIDLEKLNRGDDRKGKRPEGDAAERYGLQSQRKKMMEEGFDDETERTKRLIRTNNFTQQTNALDVDKHMLAFIEKELNKRRGAEAASKTSNTQNESFDPQSELLEVTKKYKIEKNMKLEEEGSLTNSMGMLTTIPEVDLGMENRLRNIEATEKAKREMLESRKAESAPFKKKAEDEDFSSARCEIIYLLLYLSFSELFIKPDRPRHEQATDDQVYERFKKRSVFLPLF